MEYAEFFAVSVEELHSWRESGLPTALPAEIRNLAIPGARVHARFAGKDVWFWDREGLRRLLDHLAGLDPQELAESKLAIDCIFGYRWLGGLHGFARLEKQAESRAELQPQDALVQLGFEPEDTGEDGLLYDVVLLAGEYDDRTASGVRPGPDRWKRLRTVAWWLVVLNLIYWAGSLIGSVLGIVIYMIRGILAQN